MYNVFRGAFNVNQHEWSAVIDKKERKKMFSFRRKKKNILYVFSFKRSLPSLNPPPTTKTNAKALALVSIIGFLSLCPELKLKNN
jgi:hypothetical protein